MPGGIVVQNGIIVGVGIPVEILWVPWIRHNRIWRDKPPQGGIVVPGFVKVEAGAVVQFLAGVFIRDVGGAGIEERFPTGSIAPAPSVVPLLLA